MKFSEFAQMLKRYSSKTNAEFMIELIENISTDEIDLPEENTLSKILKGNASFSGLARKLIGKTNRELFIGYLDDFYSSYKNELITDFDLNNETDSWMEKIADIFISIINNENQIGIKRMSTSKELTEVKDLVLDSTEPSIEEANDMIKSTMNKAINAVEKIQSAKLPDELQPYYEVKYSHTNDDTYEHIVAKNKEAYEKYPFNMKVTFDMSDMSEEERKKRLDINRLSEEANMKNKAILIGKTLHIEDYLGDIKSPFQRNTKGLMLYIMPKPTEELPVRSFTIKMQNDFIQLNFNHIDMHLLGLHDNGYTVSNSRFNGTFDLTFSMTKETDRMNFHYNYNVRDEYKFDAEENLKLYKWKILGQDKRTKMYLSIDDPNHVLIDQYCNGKVTYTKKDIKNINETIEYFNKVIFIQNTLGYKFKVCEETFYVNRNATDIIYNFIKKKKKTFNCELSFELPIEDNDESLVGTVLNDVTLGLGKVAMYDEEILINNTEVEMKEAIIKRIEKKNDQYIAIVVTQKAKIISK